MTWPGEHNYTRSARVRGARRKGRHSPPPQAPGHYLGECAPLASRADAHVCDATCRYLTAALKDNALLDEYHYTGNEPPGGTLT